jgi:phosphatidylglycerophosphate synthase
MLKGSRKLAHAQARIGELLAQAPLSANAWTALSVMAGIAGFGALFFADSLVLGMVCFTASFAFDAIDGAVARAKKQASPRGAFLDGIFDRVNEFFLITGLMSYPFPDFVLAPGAWLLVILFFGTCMTSFVKAYAEHTGALSHKKAHSLPGIMERAERAVLLLLAMLVSLFSPLYAVVLLALIAVLSVATVADRFRAVIFAN